MLCFDFDVLELPRLDAQAYAKIPDPAALALAARMSFRSECRVSLVKDFALTLAQTPAGKSVRDMVARFFFSYQRLSAAESLQIRQEVAKVESKEMRDRIMQVTNPWIEAGKQEGLQQGIVKGRQRGEAALVIRQLNRRLGALSPSQERAVGKLPLAKIEELGEALLEFHSRTELARWLRQNK